MQKFWCLVAHKQLRFLGQRSTEVSYPTKTIISVTKRKFWQLRDLLVTTATPALTTAYALLDCSIRNRYRTSKNGTRRAQNPQKEILKLYTLPEGYAVRYHDIACEMLTSNALCWFVSVRTFLWTMQWHHLVDSCPKSYAIETSSHALETGSIYAGSQVRIVIHIMPKI